MGQCQASHLKRSQDFLKTSKVGLTNQSPFSQDLNIWDRFLFRKLNSGIKNQSFEGQEDILQAIQQAMKDITKEELSDQLIIIKRRSQRGGARPQRGPGAAPRWGSRGEAPEQGRIQSKISEGVQNFQVGGALFNS